MPLPEEGDEIGPYRLRRELGEGAFARVFLAEQSDLGGRPVVLKVSTRPSPEARLLARARHAHIVEVFDRIEAEDGSLHLVSMPFLGGATLGRVNSEGEGRPRSGRDLLARLDAASAPEYPPAGVARPAREIVLKLSYPKAIAYLFARLAEALDHAQRKGVTHGDLKPSNILLTADGLPMLFDFNLAVDWDDPEGAGEGGGTLPYMPPERLRAIASARSGERGPDAPDGRRPPPRRHLRDGPGPGRDAHPRGPGRPAADRIGPEGPGRRDRRRPRGAGRVPGLVEAADPRRPPADPGPLPRARPRRPLRQRPRPGGRPRPLAQGPPAPGRPRRPPAGPAGPLVPTSPHPGGRGGPDLPGRRRRRDLDRAPLQEHPSRRGRGEVRPDRRQGRPRPVRQPDPRLVRPEADRPGRGRRPQAEPVRRPRRPALAAPRRRPLASTRPTATSSSC